MRIFKKFVPFLILFLVASLGSLAGQSESGSRSLGSVAPVSAAASGSASSGAILAPGTVGNTSSGPSSGYQPQADAGFTGTFTWSYPIRLPVGTHGVQPNLSLSYNSAGPNGLLGMGFQLSGFSSIERDSSRGAISFASTDTFVLDGQRLYWGWKDSQFHPERETFDRIQAFTVSGGPTTATANPNLFDSYWVVSKKDGTKLYYGQTADSRVAAVGKVDAQGRPLARAWALNRVEDSLGNYYAIEYQQDLTTGAYYPLAIVYTKNDAHPMTKWIKVEFIYGSRNDHAARFAPTRIDLDKRLTSIAVYVNVEASGLQTHLRTFSIDYTYSGMTGRSRVTSIQEFGSNYVAGGLTKLSWNQEAYDAAVFSSRTEEAPRPPAKDSRIWSSSITSEKAPAFQMIDMTGDGMPDFTYQQDSTHFIVARNRGNLFTPPENWNPGVTNSKSPYFQLVDMNGDRLPDFTYQEDSTHFYVALNTGNGFGPKTIWASKITSAKAPYFQLIDMNGDGRPDFTYQEDLSHFYVAMNTGGAFANPEVWSSGITSAKAPYFELVDMNSDGLPDFTYQEDATHFYVALNTGKGFAPYSVWKSGITSAKYPLFQMVDMNGDGKPDFTYQEDATRFYVALNNGTAFEPYQVWNPGVTALKSPYFELVDMNGDGLPDFTCQVDAQHFNVALNTGRGFAPYLSWPAGITDTKSPAFQMLDMNGDSFPDFTFQQDISNFWVARNSGKGFGLRNAYGPPNSNVSYSIGPPPPGSPMETFGLPDLLTSVFLSTGGKLDVTYKPVAQIPVVPGISEPIVPALSRWPNVSVASTKPLVTNIKVTDGLPNTPTISTSYQYWNGTGTSSQIFYGEYSLQGFSRDQAYLGFQKVTKTDDNTGLQTITIFSQDFPFQGMPLTTTVQSRLGQKYSKTETYYVATSADPNNTIDYMPRVKFVAPQKVINRLFDLQSIPVDTMQSFAYDQNGNVTTTQNWGRLVSTPDTSELNTAAGNYYRSPLGADLSVADNLRTEFSYSWNSTGTLCRLYQKKAYGYNSLGQEVLASDSRTYFDGSTSLGVVTNGLATINETVLTASPTETVARSAVSYDFWGNPIQLTDAGGVISQTTTFDSAYHSLITSTTDARGLTSTVTAWDRLLPVSLLDPQGNQAQTAYDAFGRVTKTVSPLTRDSLSSPTTSKTYNDSFSPSNPLNVVTAEKTTGSTSLSTFTYLDGLGRVVQTKTQAKASGEWITVDKYYDASGRNSSVSSPYLSPGSSFTYSAVDSVQRRTVFLYDDVGRITKTTNPDGTTNKTEYLQARIRSVDALGRVSETESAGNVRYQRTYTGVYPGQTLYTTVTARSYVGQSILEDDKDNNFLTPGNKIVTLFDLAGRKTQYTDPDMGTWTYEYNTNGSLKRQTDNLGNALSFEYDSIGRVSKKYVNGVLSAKYAYGTAEDYQKGRLISVTLAGATTPFIEYQYDKLGRTTKVSKTIAPWGTRSYQLTYNEDGRLATKRSSWNSEELTYNYASEGNLQSLTGDARYLDAVTTDAWGRVEKQRFGNSTETSNVFDPVTFRTTDIITPGVMNLHYSFDDVGQVATKTDNLNSSFSESYTYDSLGRLETALGGYGSRSYRYDALNNLLGMNGIETNLYSDPRPHAIGGDGTASYGYDGNGNMVSRTTAGVEDRRYTYDGENRLTQATVAGVLTQYTYDDSRQRVSMKQGTKTTVFWFDDYEETFDSTVTNLLVPVAYPYAPNTDYLQTDWVTNDGWTTLAGAPLIFRYGYVQADPSGMLRENLVAPSPLPRVLEMRAGAISIDPSISVEFKVYGVWVSAPSFGVTTTTVDVSIPMPPNATAVRFTDIGTQLRVRWLKVSPVATATVPNNTAGAGYVQSDFATDDGWKVGEWWNGSGAGSAASVNVTQAGYLPLVNLPAYTWVAKNNFSVLGSSNRLLAFRMRQTSGVVGDSFEIQWGTQSHAWSGSLNYVGSFPNTALNQWFTVTVDMANIGPKGNDWLTSTIKSVRMLFSEKAGQSYDIDWVYIGDGSTLAVPFHYPLSPQSPPTFYKARFTSTQNWTGSPSAIAAGALVSNLTTTSPLTLSKAVPALSQVRVRLKSDVATTITLALGSETYPVYLKAGEWTNVQSAFGNPGTSLNLQSAQAGVLTIESLYIGAGTEEVGLIDYRQSISNVAQVSPQGTTYLYQDHLGSTAVTADETGLVTARSYYDPFGKIIATGDATVRQMFTGQDWDGESDMYYYNARFYLPNLGRFIQGDPAVADLQFSSPLSLSERMNPYLYCLNNPVSFTDPTGLMTPAETAAYYAYQANQNLKVTSTSVTTTERDKNDKTTSLDAAKDAADQAAKNAEAARAEASRAAAKAAAQAAAAKAAADKAAALAQINGFLPGYANAGSALRNFQGGEYGWAALYELGAVVDDITFVLGGGLGKTVATKLFGQAFKGASGASVPASTVASASTKLLASDGRAVVPFESIPLGAIYVPVVDAAGVKVGGVVLEGHVFGGALGELITPR